jgi:hypothetical protein
MRGITGCANTGVKTVNLCASQPGRLSILNEIVVLAWNIAMLATYIIWLSNISILSVPGESYSRKASCVNCKIIGKVKIETTAMWGLTLIILKDIKCFQIWSIIFVVLIRIPLQCLILQWKRSVNKPTLDFWQMLLRPVISRMRTLDGS